jgi:hypothetical protein
MLLRKISGGQRSQSFTKDKIKDSLYPAALKGDWQSANELHKKNPNANIWERPITQQKMNALQVAVAAKKTTFVKKVLKCMTEKGVRIQKCQRRYSSCHCCSVRKCENC